MSQRKLVLGPRRTQCLCWGTPNALSATSCTRCGVPGTWTPLPEFPVPRRLWGDDRTPVPSPAPGRGASHPKSRESSPFPHREGGQGVRSAIPNQAVARNTRGNCATGHQPGASPVAWLTTTRNRAWSETRPFAYRRLLSRRHLLPWDRPALTEATRGTTPLGSSQGASLLSRRKTTGLKPSVQQVRTSPFSFTHG